MICQSWCYHKQSLWNKMLEPCHGMFKVICDKMEHWYDMWNTIIIAINFCNANKNELCMHVYHKHHYGKKCLSNLLQLEPCSVMLKVISDIMVHWYVMWNTIIIPINFKENELFIDVYHLLWNKMSYLLQLELHHGMFKVICDKMAHWYVMWNTIIIAINFCYAKNCSLMLIMINHYGRKCLSNIYYRQNHVVLCLKWFRT